MSATTVAGELGRPYCVRQFSVTWAQGSGSLAFSLLKPSRRQGLVRLHKTWSGRAQASKPNLQVAQHYSIMLSPGSQILFAFEGEDLQDVADQFGTTRSFDADSFSFISDQPGPGCTLDQIISVAGRRLEIALRRISERLGRGPNAAMNRCIAAADRGWLRITQTGLASLVTRESSFDILHP
ncbi:hypothetical protein JAAARDRAFT_198212 [Jaapia argillacea MUCL 33604]|uniref:Uncharacterized protein n=1 Tax=Jaapia argillacea MUCL 33604 TaxID=933084 RepID=A0A067PMQ1_9AGAM|nr:hypothetical protein JAAARDRAFT_198212 [Jaapia argillacea MUCL 33604]